MSINDPTEHVFGSKPSIYELEDNLEDETLRLIMNPQDQNSHKLTSAGGAPDKRLNTKLETEKDSQQLGYRNLLNKKHPNAIVFDDMGRLFVGDSLGQINVWQVNIQFDQVKVPEDLHFLIKHKEIEGDQINEIIVPEDSKNQLYIHSRDNCIRLIEFETSRGTRVKKRFFGSRCQNHMIQSALSPDG
jgi:hypothetical protein